MYVLKPHSCHGDLPNPKTNILINHDGRACLAGFTLISIVSDQSPSTSPFKTGGTINWMSPELLDSERFGLKESRPTKESDYYALGMVVYEVLSGQRPFAPYSTPVVIWKILGGERPGRPEGAQGSWFTDDIWRMLGLCWKAQPGDRPGLNTVLRCLESVTRPYTDGDVEVDADAQSVTTTASDSSTFLCCLRSQAHPQPFLRRKRFDNCTSDDAKPWYVSPPRSPGFPQLFSWRNRSAGWPT